MRSWSVGKVVGLTLGILITGACGSSDPSTAPPISLGGDAAATYDAGGGGSSSGSSSGGNSGDDADVEDAADETGDDGGNTGACPTTCSSDSDCQNSCPPVQGGGTNCCDTGSGICYATTQSSCPKAADAGKE